MLWVLKECFSIWLNSSIFFFTVLLSSLFFSSEIVSDSFFSFSTSFIFLVFCSSECYWSLFSSSSIFFVSSSSSLLIHKTLSKSQYMRIPKLQVLQMTINKMTLMCKKLSRLYRPFSQRIIWPYLRYLRALIANNKNH
jgi:hypothetical protein